MENVTTGLHNDTNKHVWNFVS